MDFDRNADGHRPQPNPSEDPSASDDLQVLEPRMMFDGAAGAEFVDTLADTLAAGQTDAAMKVSDTSQETLAADLASASAQNSVYVIDGGLDDVAGLTAQVPDGAEIIMIDASSEGVQAIVTALSGRGDLDAIHILSHGREGSLSLGTSTVTAETLANEHAALAQALGAALSDAGDLLIYGCDFGSDGADVAAWAAATGADVAASDDLTGLAGLGGDWDLEVVTGSVEAPAFVAADWAHTMASSAETGIGGGGESVPGESYSFSVSLSNPGPDTAEFPYVNVWIPEGTDGSTSATYQGEALNPVDTVSYNSSGTPSPANHPVTGQALPSGAGYENAVLQIYQLPILEVTTADTETVNFTTTFDPADASNTYGTDKIFRAQTFYDDTTDGFVVDGSPATQTVSIEPAAISKSFTNETGEIDDNPPGPNFPLTFTLDVVLQEGQTYDNFEITDQFGPQLIYLPGTLEVDGTPVSDTEGGSFTVSGYTFTVTEIPAATVGTDNVLILTLDPGSVGGADPISISYEAYIGDGTAGGAGTTVGTNGAPAANTLINESSLTGQVTVDTVPYPFDAGADPVVGFDGDGTDTQTTIEAISVQKTVSLIDLDGSGEASPDDRLEWTISIDISDYWAGQNIILDDVLGDGQDVDLTFAPTLEVSQNGVTTSDTFTYGGPNVSVGTPNVDGTTDIQFDVSAQMGGLGRLSGDQYGGDSAGDGPSTITVVFRSVILQEYRTNQETGAATPDPIDVSDTLSNSITISADVDGSDADTVFDPVTEASAASITTGTPTISKEVYAVNGDTGQTDTFGVGDYVTYRVTIDLP